MRTLSQKKKEKKRKDREREEEKKRDKRKINKATSFKLRTQKTNYSLQVSVKIRERAVVEY